MFPKYKHESFYSNVANNEIRYKRDIFNGGATIYAYNCQSEVLDFDDMFSNHNLAEELEPFEEGENYMENFDPALFCPDIIMELGDTPIKIDTDEVTIDDNANKESILLHAPVYEDKRIDGSVELTPEEDGIRKQTYGTDHPVQYTRIHCTACNDHLGSALSERSNIMVHPLLKVLICKECYDFYTSGEFEKDYDGSETYCRWCGQGGLVICCSKCEFVFCTRCIRNNFGRKILTRIRDSDEWTCFKCDTSQLIQLKVQCAELMEYVKRETARACTLENAAAFMNTDYTRCCVIKNTHENRQPRKVKRKSSDDDQDYDPDAEQVSHPSSSSSSVKSVSSTCIEANTGTVRKPVLIMPKPVNVAPKSIGIDNKGCQTSTTTTCGVANRTKITFVSHPKPLVHMPNQPYTPLGVRGFTKESSQIRMLSNGQRVAIITPRNFVPPSAGARQTSNRKTPLQPDGNAEQQRKKMCYETAVRAATRINFDLSSNLKKLMEEKMNAKKLDDLVMVHNKLQEALHGSISSLIQLRKTLTVADLNRSSVQAPSQNASISKQLHFNPEIVSNFFKVAPSAALKNFNIGYPANFDETKFIGIQEPKGCIGNAGSGFHNPSGAPFLIISGAGTSTKPGENIAHAK